VFDGERGHLPRADHDRVPTIQAAEHLGAEVGPGRHEHVRGRADPGLGRTRRPVLTAALNTAASDGPAARPSARLSASRTCDRIWLSSTIESSPLATVSRCSAASPS
jgi:hypothetical protein